jgi:hypothetical protein
MSKKLTVIFANDLEFRMLQEPVKHRSVQIELTAEQIEQVKPKRIGSVNNAEQFESISMCFLEEQTQ